MKRFLASLLALVAAVSAIAQSADQLATKNGWIYKGNNTSVEIQADWRVDGVDVVFMSRAFKRGGVISIGDLWWDSGNHYSPWDGVMAFGNGISGDSRTFPTDALFYCTSDNGQMPTQNSNGSWSYPPGFHARQCGIFSGLSGNQGNGTYALATISLPRDFSSGKVSIPTNSYDGRYGKSRTGGTGMFQMVGYKQYLDRDSNIILAIEDSDNDYNDIILRVRTNAPPANAGLTPGIEWELKPSAPVPAGQAYSIMARGRDMDDDLKQVNVWKSPGSGGTAPVGTPPAPNYSDFARATGGGITGGLSSAGRSTSDTTAGTYTYFAQAVDSLGNASPIITTTVTVTAAPIVPKTPPTVTLSGTSGVISISASKKKP